MYIHKQFIKENITDKDAQKSFAFFLLLKRLIPNSVIYSTTTNVDVAKWLGIDRRTVKKFMDDCWNRGWIKKTGEHRRLKSIDRDYEYKLQTNGKRDKYNKGKYLRVFINENQTLSEVKTIIRGLLVKSYYQRQLFTKFTTEKRELLTKRETKEFWKRGYDFGKTSGAESVFGVEIGIRFMGKIMGVSKSTADREVKKMLDKRLIVKKTGLIITKGRYINLKDEFKNNLPYGHFIYNGVVYHKKLNSYAF